MDSKQFSDEVNSIVKSRKEFIERHYIRVRSAFQETYDWPEMDILRHEICLSIIFGMCQAAITLTNHFLEGILKHSLIYHSEQGRKEKEGPIVAFFVRVFAPGRKKFGKQGLYKNIESAFSEGLITEEERETLHQFRNKFRNAYSHSDKEKTFGETEITGRGIHIEGDRFVLDNEETARIADIDFVQGLAQAFQAQTDAIPYFLYMDSFARRIKQKLFPEANTAAA